MATRHLRFSVDRGYLPFILMFLAAAALIIIGQLGERLGWWGDVGLWFTAAGVALGAVAIGVTVLYGASRPQVASLALALVVGFRESHVRHDQTNEELRQTNERLDESNQLLRDIRDRL